MLFRTRKSRTRRMLNWFSSMFSSFSRWFSKIRG